MKGFDGRVLMGSVHAAMPFVDGLDDTVTNRLWDLLQQPTDGNPKMIWSVCPYSSIVCLSVDVVNSYVQYSTTLLQYMHAHVKSCQEACPIAEILNLLQSPFVLNFS